MPQNPRYSENYGMQFVEVDSTTTIVGDAIAGFLCKTAGTITVNDGSTVRVSAHPVTAGAYYPIPGTLTNFTAPATFVCAGGASGTLFT